MPNTSYTYVTYPTSTMNSTSNSVFYTNELNQSFSEGQEQMALDAWWEDYKLAKKQKSNQTVQKPVGTKNIRYLNEP